MARRRDIKLVDLCKLNTDTFRHMTTPQLRRTVYKIGGIGDFTKAELHRADGYGVPKKIERKSRHNNALVSKYVREVIAFKGDDNSPGFVRWHKDKYGSPPPPNPPDIIEVIKRQADRLEKAIWDLQVRAGCPVKPNEMVARDAERVGDKRAVARIRKKPIIR